MVVQKPKAVLVLALLPLGLLAGCMAIPAGHKVLHEKDLSRRTTDESRVLRRAEMRLGSPSAAGVLTATLTGQYDVTTTGERYVEQEVRVRKVILGFAPFEGAYSWIGQQVPRSPFRDLSEAVDKNPAMAVILVPVAAIFIVAGQIITAGSWVTEFWQDWEPPPEVLDCRVAAFPATIIGWCKTGKTDTVHRKVPTTSREERSQPLSGATVRLIVAGGQVTKDAQTDAAGQATLDLGRIPILTAQTLKVRAEVSGPKRLPEPVTVDVPGSLFGRNLNLWENLTGLGFSVLHLDGEALDFSIGPTMPKPTAVVRTEIIGRKPEAPGVFSLRITVENTGKGPLYRALGRTVAEETALDKQLMIFGKIEPGKRVTRDLRLPITRDFRTGRYKLTVEFREANGNAPPPEEMMIDVD